MTIGVILAGKTFTQMLFSPFVAMLTGRCDNCQWERINIKDWLLNPNVCWIYYPIHVNNVYVKIHILHLIIAFAFAPTALWMMGARTFQGIGSSLTMAAGLGALSHAYDDDKERGTAIARVACS